MLLATTRLLLRPQPVMMRRTMTVAVISARQTHSTRQPRERLQVSVHTGS
jgi:hypothetical protein